MQRGPVCEGESAGGFPTIRISDLRFEISDLKSAKKIELEIDRLVYIVNQAIAKKPVAKGRAQRVSFLPHQRLAAFRFNNARVVRMQIHYATSDNGGDGGAAKAPTVKRCIAAL